MFVSKREPASKNASIGRPICMKDCPGVSREGLGGGLAADMLARVLSRLLKMRKNYGNGEVSLACIGERIT